MKRKYLFGLAIVSIMFGMIMSSQTALALPFVSGDVFASTGNGKVQVYNQTGVWKQELDTTLGGYTTGGTFDSAGNFYVTAISANSISKFDINGNLIDAHWSTGISAPESIVFNAAGDAYIGNAGVTQIQKVDSAGTGLTVYNTLQNTDWIDLAADQKTLLYSNEGSTIRELNTNTLVDTIFTTGSYGSLYSKRYLSDGGVIAASNTGSVYRWDSSGVLQQTYSLSIGSIFALNLDPNGTSFWTGTTGGVDIVKVSLSTGEIEQSWSTGTGSNYGLAVFGEIQAGGGGFDDGNQSVPEPSTLLLLGSGLAGLGFYTRKRKKA